MAVPDRIAFMVPALGVLSRSGGSGTFVEIFSAVSGMMGLTESDLQQTFPHSGKKIARDRMGHALRELKTAGCVDYTRDSWMWSLTEAGRAAWAEADGGPKAAEAVAARLRAEERRARQERNKPHKVSKSDPPARAGSYEQGYSTGAKEGRSEAKLLVKHWLDAYSKGGGEAALNELRRWASG